ncbi:hypothetical protein [Actinomadura rugatobispora]|uniref:Uncharacterized protein n=1 Tax=Actinomadura rugatobispora TaxID=1994 RepID=A0ABW1ABM6_9ACTN|nr:hypothetical protein GCM10010200_017470 [Actinomadura rugatobispora]
MTTAKAAFFTRVGPELYRENPFRVAGLSIDAGARDIRRRTEELQIKAKIGAGPGSGSTPLPLDPPPDLETAQEAVQRLRDPLRRIEAELFWFWPSHNAASKGVRDEALEALRAGDIARAEELWTNPGPGRATAVAAHNLAVLAHARALDAGGLDPAGDELWTKALRNWRAVLGNDAFWDLVAARVREADDPRLGPGSAEELRERLPAALLSISARLVVDVARDGGHAQARAHVDQMSRAGFAERAVGAALRDASGADTARLRAMGKSAAERVAADPTRGAEEAGRLLDQAEPLLAALRAVLPSDDSLLLGIRDEIAAHAMRCVVMYVNKTDGWQDASAPLERALAISATEANRTHVQKNLDTVRDNLVYATCWFCKERKPDEASIYEQPMYGDVNRQVVPYGYNARQVQTTWRKMSVRVPRCAQCVQAQKSRTGKVWGIGCGVNLAVLALAVILMMSGAVAVGIILIVLDVIGFGVLANVAETNGLAKQEFKSLNEYPPIKEQLRAGWQFGEKPPNAGN